MKLKKEAQCCHSWLLKILRSAHISPNPMYEEWTCSPRTIWSYPVMSMCSPTVLYFIFFMTSTLSCKITFLSLRPLVPVSFLQRVCLKQCKLCQNALSNLKMSENVGGGELRCHAFNAPRLTLECSFAVLWNLGLVILVAMSWYPQKYWEYCHH